MYDIVIDENIPLIDIILSQHYHVIKKPARSITNVLLKELNPQFLIVRSQTKIDKELIDGTNIKFIGTATSGVDHVDESYLNENGIVFRSASGSNATSVAEYVIFSILHWAYINRISLDKKKLGIVGFGSIGTRLAHFADSLGFKILVNDPPLRDSNFNFPGFVSYLELDELMANSDIVTNHIPITYNGKYPTYNLFDEKLLKKLPTQSLFISTSRGGIANESALLELINQDKIQAVIDVWEGEPNYNMELANHAIIATPHIAGHSYDGKLNGVLMMINAVSKYCGYKFYTAPLVDILSYESKLDISKIGINQLYKKLLNSRLLISDCEKFKSSISGDEVERALMFDIIRREYPYRREILSSSFDVFTIG